MSEIELLPAEELAAFLVLLAREGVPPDVQESLLLGGSLSRVLAAWSRRSPPQVGRGMVLEALLGARRYVSMWETPTASALLPKVDAAIDMLQVAALSVPPAEEAGRWLPIDSAPNERVQVWVPSKDGPGWDMPADPTSITTVQGRMWIGYGGCACWPTHWRPLPSPPGLSPSPSVEGSGGSPSASLPDGTTVAPAPVKGW